MESLLSVPWYTIEYLGIGTFHPTVIDVFIISPREKVDVGRRLLPSSRK